MSQPEQWRPEQSVGFYPLRPLQFGEILGASIKIAARHLILLVPLALIVSGLSAIPLIWIASSASGEAGVALLTGAQALPTSPTPAQLESLLSDLSPFVWAMALSFVIGMILQPLIVGVATPLTAQAATSRVGTDAGAFQRLAGRWGMVIGAGALETLAVVAAGACVAVVGFLLLSIDSAGGLAAIALLAGIIPVMMLAIGLTISVPVAAMEGAPPATALRRSWKLTHGHKWRVFGLLIVSGLLALVAAMVVDSILGAVLSVDSPTTAFAVSQVISAVVGAFTGAWLACLTALIYVDLRIRKEGLADALARTLV